MTTLFLIRHSLQLRNDGITNTNETDQIANEKIILSINGEKEAERISKLNELQKINVIWSSSYVRAKQTAKYFAYENNLNINVDSCFDERKLGNLDELKNLGEKYTHTFVEEQLIDNNLKTSNGESMIEVKERMTTAINNILNEYRDKRIIIVSHGAAIKFYLMNYCHLNEEIKIVYKDNILDFSSPSIIKLTFDGNTLIDIKNVELLDLKNILISNIDKIHTTKLGEDRIKKNIKINSDVVIYLKNKILDDKSIVYKEGKNYYCEIDNIRITINSYNYSIITAHIKK